jgi:rhodanese-related sulfurtransferase
MIRALSAVQAAQLLQQAPGAVLLDVREPWEVQLAAVNAPFVHMPMRSVPSRLADLDDSAPIVCMCHHGMRSLQVAHFLVQHGYADVYNLSGGIDAWSAFIDPQVARY